MTKKVNFEAYSKYVTDSLYQWDINQTLTITGLNLTKTPEVHFSNREMDRAIVRQSTYKNGVITVDIPNSLLQSPARIYAHIGIYEGDTFKTIEVVEIPVIARVKPADYQILDSDEEIYSFKELENKISNSVEVFDKKVEANNELINARVDNLLSAKGLEATEIELLTDYGDEYLSIDSIKAVTNGVVAMLIVTGVNRVGSTAIGNIELFKLPDELTPFDNSLYIDGDKFNIDVGSDNIARIGFNASVDNEDIYHTYNLNNPYIYELIDSRVGVGGITYDSVGTAVRNSEKRLEILKNLIGVESIMCVDAFNSENATVSVPTNAPFILPIDGYNYKDCVIERIKLNIRTIGTISVGYTTRLLTHGETYSDTDFVVVDVLTTTKHGEQTLALNTPFIVPDNCMLFIGYPTDTGYFLYGSFGTDKEFLFNSYGTYMTSGNSLGIDVIGTKVPKKSVYRGKTLSILGDSISTYDGYIPSGNATYYPSTTVNAVEKTWWHKLLTALGMTLEVNNSWSGSTVTTVNGENSAGCMSRCENLGDNPDVIIVWLGINDFNGEVSLGDYDGTTSIPENTTTFTDAYAVMLDKILTKYKTSEVWVCTLPSCERNDNRDFPEINGNGVALSQFNKAIKELAEAFGVKVLDHNKCGLTYRNMSVYDPDELHPNADGHSLIANNDIWQMEPTIKTRY